MNEQKIYNEILRASSEDTKYKPMGKSSNKDILVVIGVIILIVIIILKV